MAESEIRQEKNETASPEAPRITLTREAAAFVQERLKQDNRAGAALRVGVRGGGCNGLIYVLDYTEDPPKKRDLVYEFFGTRVYVDKRSLEYIDGSTIFLENTLMFRGLKFDNPLESSTCGCGETFSVKDEVLEKRRQQRKQALPTTPR